jgi:hypothetical protein
MKNRYKLPIFLFLAVLFIGCETEDVKTSNGEESRAFIESKNSLYDFKVEVKNDMLSFTTREDYDRAIDYLNQLGDNNFEAFEADLSFTSMRSEYNIDELNKRGINDPFLATILNPNGLIEIAGYTFKIDMLSETVTMQTSTEYKNSNKTLKGGRTFSTDENVLDILDGTADEGTSESSRRRYCRRSRKTGSISVGGSRTTYILEYRRAGILNTLGAIMFDKYNISSHMKTKGISFYKSKTRCINENNRNSSGRTGYSIVRIYNSSRRLKAYNLDVEFIAIHTNPSLGSTIKRDRIYCGRQVACR